MTRDIISHSKMSHHLPNFAAGIIKEVSAIMKIPYEPWMQDWPVEVSDGTRVEDFLLSCENENRPDHRTVMVEVLLVSLDDAFLQGQPHEEILTRAARVLAKNPELLEYWRRPKAAEGEMFAITSWVRSLDFTL